MWAALPETHAAQTPGGGFVRFLSEMRSLLTSRTFVGYVLAGSFSSALFFVFLNLLVDIAQASIDPRIKRS